MEPNKDQKAVSPALGFCAFLLYLIVSQWHTLLGTLFPERLSLAGTIACGRNYFGAHIQAPFSNPTIRSPPPPPPRRPASTSRPPRLLRDPRGAGARGHLELLRGHVARGALQALHRHVGVPRAIFEGPKAPSESPTQVSGHLYM